MSESVTSTQDKPVNIWKWAEGKKNVMIGHMHNPVTGNMEAFGLSLDDKQPAARANNDSHPAAHSDQRAAG